MAFFAPKSKMLDVSMTAIVDNLIFSKTNVWAGYRMESSMYDFVGAEGRIKDAANLADVMRTLMEDRAEKLDIQVLSTTTPIDVEAWEAMVESVSEFWGTPDTFDVFLDRMANYLRSEAYARKVVYLFIDLGRRRALDTSSLNPLEHGIKDAFATLKEWGSMAVRPIAEEISVAEERRWRQAEESIRRVIGTGLAIEPMQADESLLLVKRSLYPAMEVPYLDIDHEHRLNAGDLEMEYASVIINHYRALEFRQMIGNDEVTGYRATVSLNKFPKVSTYPYSAAPFLYLPHQKGYPLTVWARLSLIPSEKMRKEVGKKQAEMADQITNKGKGGTSAEDLVAADDSDEEAVQDVKDMAALTQSDRTPWVEGSYHVVVEAPTMKGVRDMAQEIKKMYSNLGINAVLTAGDQKELFLSQMPADKVRVNSFKQVTNLNSFAASGFNLGGEVGDLFPESD